jgi:2-keto-4-pentenoate hydratase/2-oxohepta-3-ene-1,7-dioic acid hydratase in catechol pathway
VPKPGEYFADHLTKSGLLVAIFWEQAVRLASFQTAGSVHVGVVHSSDAKIFDLTKAARDDDRPGMAFLSMLDLIDGGRAALECAQGLFERRSDDPRFELKVEVAALLAPLPEPRQMRDFMVFEKHILQSSRGMKRLIARARGDESEAQDAKALAVPEIYRHHPCNYLTNRFSVVGHGAMVRWPSYSKVMDFELELAMVTGRKGSNIRAAVARDYIFGFTIFNDFSARDTQIVEMPTMMGPGKAKSFDTGNAVGPWIVTADEFRNPYALSMCARVNGEIWSRATSEGMIFSFEDMIVHTSTEETLQAGEIFGAGTVGGGCGLEFDRFLKNGDVVELEVEGIGVLRNTIQRHDVV